MVPELTDNECDSSDEEEEVDSEASLEDKINFGPNQTGFREGREHLSLLDGFEEDLFDCDIEIVPLADNKPSPDQSVPLPVIVNKPEFTIAARSNGVIPSLKTRPMHKRKPSDLFAGQMSHTPCGPDHPRGTVPYKSVGNTDIARRSFPKNNST